MEALHLRRRRLGTSPVFRGLTEPELDQILQIAEDLVVAKGDHIFKQGDLADAVFFIVRGRVQITKDTHVLAALGVGAVLGELSLFGGGHKRSASAKAEGEVMVVRVASRPFRKLLDAWNPATMKIVCNLTEQLTERLIALNEKLVSVTKAEAQRTSVPLWKL
jgi:CRP-like cAMP-binding protein